MLTASLYEIVTQHSSEDAWACLEIRASKTITTRTGRRNAHTQSQSCMLILNTLKAGAFGSFPTKHRGQQ